MTLTHICDFAFRNLSDQELTFPPTVDIIVVANGQDKTNLIEAINLVGLSRSFPTSPFPGTDSAMVPLIVDRD
jgi:recombinational DNA repair ATPase RecF